MADLFVRGGAGVFGLPEQAYHLCHAWLFRWQLFQLTYSQVQDFQQHTAEWHAQARLDPEQKVIKYGDDLSLTDEEGRDFKPRS